MDQRADFSVPRMLTVSLCLLIGLGLYHTAVSVVTERGGIQLGAVSNKSVPFYAYVKPHLKGWLAVPALVLSFFVLRQRRTRIETSSKHAVAVLNFGLWFLAFVMSVAILDGGFDKLVAPYQRVELEYVGAVSNVDKLGIGGFLDRYSNMIGQLPMHAQVHPPGAVLFVWLGSKLPLPAEWGAAVWTILFSSLLVPLIYYWGAALGRSEDGHIDRGAGIGRRAAALCVVAPSIVIFTATSMDGPFAVTLVAAMYCFWSGLRERHVRWGFLAGIAGWAAASLTYSVAISMLFCGILVITYLWHGLSSAYSAAKLCGSTIGSFVVCHIIVYVLVGFDPLECFLACLANHHSIMDQGRHHSFTQYALLSISHVVVFLTFIGLPVAWIWIRTLVDDRCGHSSDTPIDRRVRLMSRAAFLTVLIAAFLPLYTMEVERIWMFMVPLVILPVADRLCRLEERSGKTRLSLLLVVMLGVQTLITEICLETYW